MSAQFGDKMPEGCDGADENHARADASHHGLHHGPFVGGIAVDGTFAAAWFRVSVRTKVKPAAGIPQQRFAFRAQLSRRHTVVPVTVDRYHNADYIFFVFYA